MKIIIEIAGGLGNQMFQYALYLKLKWLGFNCKFYYNEEYRRHNGPELARAFGLKISFLSDTDLKRILLRNNDYISKFRRRILREKYFFFWEHDKGYKFKPEIFDQKKTIYLQGNWLSEKYFLDVSSAVRNAFKFTQLDEENNKILELINNCKNSVSMHIRRGDYLKSPMHLNIDYNEYLDSAIMLISQKVGDSKYFVFSDDTNFSKSLISNLLPNGNCFFVVSNTGIKSSRDMQLMAACKHNIISNSTFSWWGAWLNNNPDKIVVSPDKWFTTDFLNDNDIVPTEWIKI